MVFLKRLWAAILTTVVIAIKTPVFCLLVVLFSLIEWIDVMWKLIAAKQQLNGDKKLARFTKNDCLDTVGKIADLMEATIIFRT